MAVDDIRYSSYFDCTYRKDDCLNIATNFIMNAHYLVFKDFKLEQLKK